MRIRRLSIVAAAALVTPALVVVPTASTEARVPAAGPVATSQRSVSLEPVTSAAVGDGAHASARDLQLAKTQAVQAGVSAAAVEVARPRVLEATTPQVVPADLAVIGITWSSSVGRSTVVQYRTHFANAWHEWQAIDIDPAKGTNDEGGRAGSDPIVVTGAEQVQVRVLGPAGGAPVGAELSVIDPGEAASDTNIGVARPGSANAAAARPAIHTRSDWGANESWRKRAPDYTSYRGAIVHHTAGTNNYSQSQVPAILRGIYAFHTKDRGWNDIAYNFLVDKWGRVWEGRYGGIDRPVVGAHTSGYNSATMGVALMGDHQKADAPDAAIRSMERVIAYKAGLSGFDPDGVTTLYGRREPVVQGHRDVGQTTCPGNYVASKMGRIRRESAAMMSASTPPRAGGGAQAGAKPAAADLSDVLMRSRTGHLFRSSPIGTTGLTYATRVSSSSWSGYDAVLSAGDLDRDGDADVLARVGRSGNLVYFPGAPGNVLAGARTVGSGWGAMTHLSAGADLTGDGRGDLVAVARSTGQLYVYPGNGSGGFGRRVVAGVGFGRLAHLVGVGDVSADGKADILGVSRTGTARLYLGDGRGHVKSGPALSGSWKSYRTLVGLPGRRAVLGVDAGGAGWLISRSGATGVRRVKVAPNFTNLHVFGG